MAIEIYRKCENCQCELVLTIPTKTDADVVKLKNIQRGGMWSYTLCEVCQRHANWDWE